MTDMSQFIKAKSDQLNADDLMGGPMTILINRVTGNENADQPVNIGFDGDMGKPFRPCKSMRRVMVQAWGTDGTAYVGRSMTLYRDPDVKWAGVKVGGIRISHMSHIDGVKQLMLTATRGQKAQYTLRPLMQTASHDGPSVTAENAKDRAREAATGGKDAFIAWWNSQEGKDYRNAQGAILEAMMGELQGIAEEADEKAATDDDPFDLPPIADEHRIEASDDEAGDALGNGVIDHAPAGIA